MRPEPFLITAEDRAKAVAVLMAIITTGKPMEKIKAAQVLVEMDGLNVLAEQSRDWIPKTSDN